jgi:hypothetical protein
MLQAEVQVCMLQCTSASNTMTTLGLHIFRFLQQNPYMPTCLINYKPIAFSIRLTGFLDFVHPPVLLKLESTKFQKLDLFLSSDEWGGGLLLILVPLEELTSLGPMIEFSSF